MNIRALHGYLSQTFTLGGVLQHASLKTSLVFCEDVYGMCKTVERYHTVTHKKSIFKTLW